MIIDISKHEIIPNYLYIIYFITSNILNSSINFLRFEIHDCQFIGRANNRLPI